MFPPSFWRAVIVCLLDIPYSIKRVKRVATSKPPVAKFSTRPLRLRPWLDKDVVLRLPKNKTRFGTRGLGAAPIDERNTETGV